MIYSKFSYSNFETDYLKKINEYMQKNDVKNFEKGRYDIDDTMYVNICEYKTTQEENRVWEAHKEYFDVHVMLKGKETLKHSYLENVTIKEYHKEDDYVEIDKVEKVDSIINLDEGQYLVFGEKDVHKTAIIFEKEQEVKKAIFKVKL